MGRPDEEDDRLRSVALQNANSILVARQRAEQDLIRAKEALERKTAELARSLAMVRATLESTTDGILVTDEDGVVISFNENYARMWQVPEDVIGATPTHDQLMDWTCRSFVDPDRFVSRVREIYSSSPPETFDVLELEDGKVYERFSKIQYVQDRPVGRVWSFRDITDRTRLLESERAARAEAERNSALKDEFLATLSHELRTPLSAIIGWAMILRRGALDPSDLRNGLDTIERNARVQTQLIEDLLDMSRITSGKVRLDVQPMDPVTFIEAAIETVRPAADAKGIRIERLLDPSAGPISGDPSRLQQVVWNLLSNAIKFTAKDGKVQVMLERVSSHIEISVADTGIGIDPEFLPHVFARFRQADASPTRTHGGLGLGLSIVKSLVELHGGSITATSPGIECGTTFTVRLPLTVVHRSPERGSQRHPKAANSVPIEYRPSDLSGIRVLVVDDQGDARDLVRRVLIECDAEVFTAATVEQALVTLQRDRPHVIVSDIGMPSIDGYEFLKRVRALDPEHGGRTPAIALTAFARSEDRTRALRAGFLAHISKPVEPPELVATVAAVAGRKEEPLA